MTRHTARRPWRRIIAAAALITLEAMLPGAINAAENMIGRQSHRPLTVTAPWIWSGEDGPGDTWMCVRHRVILMQEQCLPPMCCCQKSWRGSASSLQVPGDQKKSKGMDFISRFF